ncbi:MAG: hypothetical protein KGL39_30345 [Patescibacteria group bacterium]|nr:hypothetical protein [Patescibacteria group bacterium]
MSETALTLIPVSALPTILAADADDVLGKLRRELDGYVPDATTPDGRAEIGSKAKRVGSAKQDLLRLGAGLKADHQKVLKAIVAEEKIIEERMDAMRDAILAPRVAYQEREKRRVAEHEAAIAAIPESPDYGTHESAAELSQRLQWLIAYRATPGRDFEEFEGRFLATLASEIERTERLLHIATKRESEAAELARLRAEDAERQRKGAHEAELAKLDALLQAAAAAETAHDLRTILAKLDAFPPRDWEEYREPFMATDAAARQVAQSRLAGLTEREEIARREREAEIARAAAETARQQAETEAAQRLREAEERAAEEARQAEIDRQAEEQRAAEALAEAERRAEAERAAAAQRERLAAEKAERDRQEAAQREAALAARAKAAEEQAATARAQAEREAQAAVERKAEEERRAAAAREADKAHRGRVNREAAEDLFAGGLSHKDARAAVIAIAKGAVRRVTISY